MDDEIVYRVSIMLPDYTMLDIITTQKEDVKRYLDKYWHEAGDAKVFKSLTQKEYELEFEQ